MCFWAAGLSVFVQHFGQQVWIEESMERGRGIREHIASGHGGGLAPSLYCVFFLLDFFGFLVSREDALFTLLAPPPLFFFPCFDSLVLYGRCFFLFFLFYLSTCFPSLSFFSPLTHGQFRLQFDTKTVLLSPIRFAHAMLV
ncbi:hypothetical protein LY76DRAFT_328114 [Colletotrichum caudatum]|nr:hypothetical protein LY76DRAFT_328114 [Colletotrichum caudatum]